MKIDLNDPKLTAYALGELSGGERSAMEAAVSASPEARQEVERIRELAGLLTRELKQEPAGALSQLQKIAIESETQRWVQPRRRGVPWLGLGIAATIVMSLGLYYVYRPAPDQLQLAEATQPAQKQPLSDRAKSSPAPAPAHRTAANKAAPIEKTDADLESDPMPDSGSGDAEMDEKMADNSNPPAESSQPAEPENESPAQLAPIAFQPNKGRVTTVDDVQWIDDRVAQLWSENGIKPSAVAPDGEFIRRAYLDIIGTVPSAEAAAEYIRSRERDKKVKLITQLLNSEEYPKYWAEIWSNLLVGRRPDRNRNVDKEALEKYLRDCFAENRPWNQMAYELVTATGGSTKESLKDGVPFNGATNFLLAHMNDGNVPATAFTTRLFLGVQVQCTQCHDHPFNDRTQESFWGINAFFQKMRRVEHNDVDDTGRRRFLYAELTETPASNRDDLFVRYDKRSALVAVTPPRLLDGQVIEPEDSDVKLRQELARYIIDPNNEYFAQAIVNRLWSHFLGRGIVHPADDLGTHNPASNPDLLTRLAKNFEESNYDLKRLVTWITLSNPYALSSSTNSTNKEDDQYFSHYPLKQMTPEQFFDSLIVASRADRVGAKGGWEAVDKMKADLQQQFTAVFNNDENAEADTFNGTIPQALMLMNGGMMQKAISKEPGSFLHERVQEIMKKRTRGADVALLNDLYLAALSRYPTAKEKQLAQMLLNDTMTKSKDKNPIDAYQDIFWALLNSSEFVLNH